MTIGKKIKYCRKLCNITQNKLAELTGLHPVSIRKYETDKMEPQPVQIEKIADALSISYNALIGNATAGLRLETVGDLMGILIVLFNTDILRITGERDENKYLKKETVKISFNPLLASFFEMEQTSDKKIGSIPLDNILLKIKMASMLDDLLTWEKINHMYQVTLYNTGENADKEELALLNDVIEAKEITELRLQRSQVSLDMSDGIKVKINPDYQ